MSVRFPGAREILTPLLIVVGVAAGLGCTSDATDAPAEDVERQAAVLLAKERYAEGLSLFQRAAMDRPSNYRALIGMAICHAHLGQEDRFQASAISACAAAPWGEESFLRLGSMYVRGAERFRARPSSRHYAGLGVEYLRRVFAHDPHAPNLLHNLGLGTYLMGDTRASVLFLEEAYRRNPRRLDTLEVLLVVHRALDQRDDVLRLLAPFESAGDLPVGWRGLADWAKSPAPPTRPTESVPQSGGRTSLDQ